jgi:hypothetical protein
MKPFNLPDNVGINDPAAPWNIDEVAYDRNVRNGLREEICNAISLIDDRLGELDEAGFEIYLNSLGMLREVMRRDMED